MTEIPVNIPYQYQWALICVACLILQAVTYIVQKNKHSSFFNYMENHYSYRFENCSKLSWCHRSAQFLNIEKCWLLKIIRKLFWDSKSLINSLLLCGGAYGDVEKLEQYKGTLQNPGDFLHTLNLFTMCIVMWAEDQMKYELGWAILYLNIFVVEIHVNPNEHLIKFYKNQWYQLNLP